VHNRGSAGRHRSGLPDSSLNGRSGFVPPVARAAASACTPSQSSRAHKPDAANARRAGSLIEQAEATLEEAFGVIANGYLTAHAQKWVCAAEKRRAALGRRPTPPCVRRLSAHIRGTWRITTLHRAALSQVSGSFRVLPRTLVADHNPSVASSSPARPPSYQRECPEFAFSGPAVS
jgi:hypothetical protein